MSGFSPNRAPTSHFQESRRYKGLLPLGNLTNRNGGVVTDGLAIGPPFSRGHTVVHKNGITVIHKHFFVQHHLSFVPHPWGRLHASATGLLTALGP